MLPTARKSGERGNKSCSIVVVDMGLVFTRGPRFTEFVSPESRLSELLKEVKFEVRLCLQFRNN
jgi:hypothetical protein